MSFTLTLLLFAAGLFLGMVLLQEVGRRIGIRRMAADPDGAHAGIGAVDGAIFALLGLLVAFTFSGAAARFDTRRQQVVEEANAIGTAYLRLDLLPEKPQSELREKFREYVDSRLAAYAKLPDVEAARDELARSATMQGEIWSKSVAACRAEGQSVSSMLVLPALNEMIDITSTRTMAAQTHPPLVIFALLFVLGLGCSVMAGYDMAAGRRRNWTHVIGFAAVVALTVYVILDIEYPRMGLIRLDAHDQVMADLRQSMK